MTVVSYSDNATFGGVSDDSGESPWSAVTHVKYIGASDEQVRWGSNADPRGVLIPGEVYELERVRIHSWHTKVFLAGIDCGRGFNSVSFEPVQP